MYYQFVFIPAWDSSPPLSFSPTHPSTGDKLASALQTPFNGGCQCQCRCNVALSRAGSELRCCVCVFTVIGRKVGWWKWGRRYGGNSGPLNVRVQMYREVSLLDEQWPTITDTARMAKEQPTLQSTHCSNGATRYKMRSYRTTTMQQTRTG